MDHAPERPGFTQCPGCYTLFRVDRRQVTAAAGQVRCGLCGESFDAEARFIAELPADMPRGAALIAAIEPRGREPERPREQSPARAEIVPAQRRQRPAPDESLRAEPRPPTRSPHGPSLRDDWRRATALEVEQAAETSPQGRRHQWPWVLLALLLTLALGAQLLWLQRDALARDPMWRPWLTQACAALGCELPAPSRPEAVEITARTLRAHPGVPDALLLTATVVNRADEPQPWPQLGLVLTALNGQTVARHWFDAGSYLADSPPAGELMPVETPVAIRIGFREPEPAARSFEIRFR